MKTLSALCLGASLTVLGIGAVSLPDGKSSDAVANQSQDVPEAQQFVRAELEQVRKHLQKVEAEADRAFEALLAELKARERIARLARNREAQSRRDLEIYKARTRDLHSRITELLAQLLKDQTPSVRGLAARVLGEIGADAKRAVPVLLEALKEKDEEIRDARDAAAEALKKIDLGVAAKAGVK